MMISSGAGSCGTPLVAVCTSSSAASRDEQRARPDDGADLELVGRRPRRARGCGTTWRRSSSSVSDDHERRGEPRGLEEAAAVFVDGASKSAASTARASPPARGRESRAERGLRRLAVHLVEAARHSRRRRRRRSLRRAVVPWRARPVPFWRHGFARPPETSPRLFAAHVPARCAASSARTASWTRCGLTSAPKMAVVERDLLRLAAGAPSSGAFGAAISLPHLDDAVLRAREPRP